MKRFGFAVLAVFVLVAWKTTLLLNLLSMLEGAGSYFVPAESSIFTFEPTINNPGSGSWWLFGRDHKRYYALSMTSAEYHHIPQDNSCEGFDPHRLETWCTYETSLIPR